MDDPGIVHAMYFGYGGKQKVLFDEWYERKLKKLQVEWLESVDPEEFDHYWEFVHTQYHEEEEQS